MFFAEWFSLNTAAWEQHALEGSLMPSLVYAAEEKRADVIVMGTHGRTRLVHMLLGNVAEGVVRQAACPVLTIRPDTRQFALP